MNPETYHQLLSGGYEPPAQADKVPDFGYSPLNRSGELYRPVIDELWCRNHQAPSWPQGKRFAVCLTHDVDAVAELDVRQNMRSIWKLLKTMDERPLGETLRWTLIHKLNALRGLAGRGEDLCRFERWMEVERDIGAHSTFFFAPERVLQPHRTDCMYTYEQSIAMGNGRETVASVMRRLDAGGWEIGLHPSWHAHADLEELRFQKQQVEAVLGHEISSVRQHFLKYDVQHTARIQSQAGFTCDSTLGFNDNVGFRRGTSYPFFCHDREKDQPVPLLQIPLAAQDGALMLAEKGLRLDAETAVDYVAMLMQRVKTVGGVLTLSWHPHTMHKDEFWKVYREVLQLLAREDPWFATVGEVGHWWQEHVGIDLLKFTRELSTARGTKETV